MSTDSERLDSFIWPAEFFCTIITEGVILPNHYTIKISVAPMAVKNSNINLGFKKIKYFIDNQLNNSILLNESSEFKSNLTTVNNNLVLLPQEPYDYFLASVLFTKISVIVEKYFTITHLSLDSVVGDRVQYTVNYENLMDLEIDNKYWWNQDSVNTGCDHKITWDSLNLKDEPTFIPKVIQGGLKG